MTEILDNEAADLRRANAELQRRLDECCAERDAATAREAALAEVLDVINRSPGDLAPVFGAMLEKAMRLCEAAFGGLAIFDGDTYRVVATHNIPEPLAAVFQGTLAIRPETSFGRIARGETPVHIADVSADETYRMGSPVRRALVDLAGARSALWVALRKENAVLGTFVVWRQEVRPFSDKEIALLEMENARLFGELQQRTADLQESLEYQTATSDVLKVISGSTFDIQPVFQTIVETAARLCDADQAAIYRRDGEAALLALNFGFPAEYEAAVAVGTFPLGPTRPETPVRAMLEGHPVHVHDVAAVPGYSELAIRTRKGADLARRASYARGQGDRLHPPRAPAVEPFTDRQIELVSAFADQAVIALENAGLLGELQQRTDELAARNSEFGERIEHQSATIDVLKAMSASGRSAAGVRLDRPQGARTVQHNDRCLVRIRW